MRSAFLRVLLTQVATESSSPQVTGAELANIPLDKIRTNPVALRDVNRTEESFMQLVESVRKDGVYNAISVRRKPAADGKEFELVDGLQRFTASQEAGRPTIPAQILEKDDADALLAQVVGNAHRIDTKPTEYARGLMRILGYHPTWTIAQLAAELNKSPQWIDKQLNLLKLGDGIKPLVDDGRIPLVNAYVLAKLPPEEQLEWAQRAQTMQPNEFTANALQRAKEIRDAAKKGQDAKPEEYVPVPHLRKKPELEAEMQKPEVGPALIRELRVTEQARTKDDAAALGFQLGIKWALNFDDKSIEAAKARDAERRKKEGEDKVRRDAERKEKRAQEAQKKSAEALEAANKAREAAAALPPVATA